MAKRRMVSEHLIFDEEFNSLSLEAQNIFIRLLAKSDDFGVVPAGSKILCHLINCPAEINGRLDDVLLEITRAGLGRLFEYKAKQFFVFKQESFTRYQSYIFNKRSGSEYLKVSAKEFDRIYIEMCKLEPIDRPLNVNCSSIDSLSRKDTSRKDTSNK